MKVLVKKYGDTDVEKRASLRRASFLEKQAVEEAEDVRKAIFATKCVETKHRAQQPDSTWQRKIVGQDLHNEADLSFSQGPSQAYPA